jgi:hypothetical protein
MSTTAPEYLTTIRDGFADAVQQWVDQSTSAWDQWQQAWSPAMTALGTLGMPGAPAGAPGHRTRGHRHHERGCGCGDCDHGCREPGGHRGRHHDSGCGCGEAGPHDKHHGDHHHREHHGCGCADSCDCCVPEADVIVRARAGEVRVVPFRLHNPWRREREIALEVGPWHGCDGDDLEIRAALEDEKVVLAPCEDRVVRLVVSVRGKPETDDESGDTVVDEVQDKPSKVTRATAVPPPTDVRLDPGDVRRRGGDVESCASAYADVRFEGCARPQRVAVVVLPAECDSVDVDCDCGCCC